MNIQLWQPQETKIHLLIAPFATDIRKPLEIYVRRGCSPRPCKKHHFCLTSIWRTLKKVKLQEGTGNFQNHHKHLSIFTYVCQLSTLPHLFTLKCETDSPIKNYSWPQLVFYDIQNVWTANTCLLQCPDLQLVLTDYLPNPLYGNNLHKIRIYLLIQG
jgi:hypothetical protein